MKKTDKYCTLEQAKKFTSVDLNLFPQLWIYRNGFSGIVSVNQAGEMLKTEKEVLMAPAIDCAELGLMCVAEDDDMYFSFTSYNSHQGNWETTVDQRNESAEGFTTLFTGEGDTEAEAKADAVIYMLDHGITSIQHLNELLKDES